MIDTPPLAPDSVARLLLTLHWESGGVTFEDRRLVDKVHCGLDLFPPGLLDMLLGRRPGETVRLDYGPGELAGAVDGSLQGRVPRDGFDTGFIPGRSLEPAVGRFFPRGVLHRGMPGIFKADARPFRVTAVDDDVLEVDLNPPFAGRAAGLEAEIQAVRGGSGAMDGRCADLAALLTDGPGMQARVAPDRPTDFFRPDAFVRRAPDEGAPPMDVSPDSRAVAEMTALYGRFLAPGMRVLDLTGGHSSPLPEGIDVAGGPTLGPSADPPLPFEDGAFDACVFSLSVAYLTRGPAVFAEVARVLAPGAPLVVAFPQGRPPSEAVALWGELHPFERPGLVLEYVHRAGGFTDLGASSLRGLPRPQDDPRWPKNLESDPVFAVWGRKA